MGRKASSNALTKVASGSIADLIGNSISIKLENGDTVIIPADHSGNRIANMIMAAQVRHLIQNSIETYRAKEMIPTPKDLKDLAEAAKSLSSFSRDVYKEDEGTPVVDTPKTAEQPTAADVDFGAVEVVSETK